MGLFIGDNNKIKNSTIANTISNVKTTSEKKNIFEKHPVICSIIISAMVAFIFLFNFWQNIVNWIEGWF